MATICICADSKKASELAFKILLELWPTIKMLGLATGSTPELLYALLIKAYQAGKLSLAKLMTINLDEYIGLEHNHAQSYFRYMWVNLFSQVDVNMKNVRIPSCYSSSNQEISETCIQMEKWIKEQGPVTAWILGMGEDAHFGFLIPGHKNDKQGRYHATGLSLSTREANKRFFNGDINAVPVGAITAGWRTVKEGKHLIQLAFGPKKEWAVSASVLGPMTGWVPSSLLQDHPDWKLIVDQEAGTGILKYLAERKIRPDEQGFYNVTSEAGITHQVEIARGLNSKFGIPRKTEAELAGDLR